MNFIGEWFLEDLTVCDKLIDYFNNNPEKQSKISDGNGQEIFKKCLQINFSSANGFKEKEISDYLFELEKVVNKYIKKYPWSNMHSPWGISEGINFQYYRPGEAFYREHCERTMAEYPTCTRHLVFMTYLNDVTDGGETEFIPQNLKVKPEKGKTLIWPADWTHTHRGIPSQTQEKYIITGWFNYTFK